MCVFVNGVGLLNWSLLESAVMWNSCHVNRLSCESAVMWISCNHKLCWKCFHIFLLISHCCVVFFFLFVNRTIFVIFCLYSTFRPRWHQLLYCLCLSVCLSVCLSLIATYVYTLLCNFTYSYCCVCITSLLCCLNSLNIRNTDSVLVAPDEFVVDFKFALIMAMNFLSNHQSLSSYQKFSKIKTIVG